MNSCTNFGVYKSTAILIELIKSFLQLLLLLNRYDRRSPHDFGKIPERYPRWKTRYFHISSNCVCFSLIEVTEAPYLLMI